jgi:hypothetical protein
MALANVLGFRPERRSVARQGSMPAAGGAFDWHRISARRTVFTVDYWPGVPSIDKEGRPNMRSDLER